MVVRQFQIQKYVVPRPERCPDIEIVVAAAPESRRLLSHAFRCAPFQSLENILKLKRARIQNFRSIKEATIEFSLQTAILGANGAGKSTVLRAIDRFFGSSNSVDLDDFYGRDASEAIEIELTFDALSSAQEDLFASRVHNGELTVTRVFDATKNTTKLYGVTLRHEPFDRIRFIDGATPKRAAYNALRAEAPIYSSLNPVSNAAQIEEQLSAWEATNPGELTLGRDNGQFLGFTNVGMGAIHRAINFVFIPAVREASADAVDQRNSVIGRLLEIVVRSAVMRREDIVQWQSRASEEFRQLTSPENMPELGSLATTLSGGLQNFYLDASVDLKWNPAQDFVAPMPGATVSLVDDGFASTVDRQGHGLQRAFILTLLHHLAKSAGETLPLLPDGLSEEQNPQQFEAPSLILGIEEPELYQHPTKQRHFANVLTRLSEGSLPGSVGPTQVLFCSHSPLFVSLRNFDQIRIARRIPAEEGRPKRCDLVASSMSSVAAMLETAYDKPHGSFSAHSLQPRLHILDDGLAEGFFARCVVLVEGPSDKATLLATARLLGANFEAHGIAILSAAGKNNADRPAAIFKSFDIPTFVLWDCDDGAGQESNRALRRLVEPGFSGTHQPITAIYSYGACFKDKLETTLIDEIGSDFFDGFLKEACIEFDVPVSKSSLKTPAIVEKLLYLAKAGGRQSVTLENITREIFKLRGVTLN